MRRSSIPDPSCRQPKEVRKAGITKTKKIRKRQELLFPSKSYNQREGKRDTKESPKSQEGDVTRPNDPRLDALSQNFQLFLHEKELNTYIHGKMTSFAFKRWRQRFTVKIYKRISKYKKNQINNNIKNEKGKKGTQNDHLHDDNQSNNEPKQKLEYKSKGTQIMDDVSNSIETTIPIYPNGNIKHNKKNVSKNKSNFLNISSPDPLFDLSLNNQNLGKKKQKNSKKIPRGVADPKKLACSILSQTSPTLIASVSPRSESGFSPHTEKEGISPSSSLELDFFNNISADTPKSSNNSLDNQNKTPLLSKQCDSKFTPHSTMTEFVPSDEFDSDSQINSGIKSPKDQKSKNSNSQNNKPNSNSCRNNNNRNNNNNNNNNNNDNKSDNNSNDINEKNSSSFNGSLGLGSTLPNDLFSSEDDEKSIANSIFKKTPLETKVPRKYENAAASKTASNGAPFQQITSPVRMDEELLIKAALSDEFKSSPGKKHKRKIIIVREYSDSDEEKFNRPSPGNNRSRQNYRYNNSYSYESGNNGYFDPNELNENSRNCPHNNYSASRKDEMNPILNKNNNNNSNFNSNHCNSISSSQIRNKKTNSPCSPIKKFTFSDESFSDNEEEEDLAKPHSTIPSYMRNNVRFTFSGDSNLGNESTINRANRKNADNDQNLSSTIEIPKDTLKPHCSPPMSTKKVQTDSSIASTNSFTDDDDSLNSDFNRNNKEDDEDNEIDDLQIKKLRKPAPSLARRDSSDEIEFLINDPNTQVKSLFSRNSSNDYDF